MGCGRRGRVCQRGLDTRRTSNSCPEVSHEIVSVTVSFTYFILIDPWLGGRSSRMGRDSVHCQYTMKGVGLLTVLSVLVISAASRPNSPSLFNFSDIISVDDILDAIRSNRTDCQQIARVFIARIRLYNARLGAVTVLNYRGALSDARHLDAYRKRSHGRLFGRLHCVPTLIKDNILVAGLPTTLGLWTFVNSTARTDAGAVWRLKTEGALILGKANLPPFSVGLKAPDEASEIAGQCRNPYSFSGGRSTSVFGSSCGNMVAQAARLSVIGLATDTAGSATWPASECGVVSVRPPSKTYDSSGIFPMLRNAGDTIAPVAATLADAALILDIISTSNRTSKNFLSQVSDRRQNGEPFRIGLIRDFVHSLHQDSMVNLTRIDGKSYEYHLDPEIFSATEHFINQLRSSNVTVVNLTISLDDFVEQIHGVHRAWTDVFACTPQWMDAFFKRYPFYVKNKGIPREVRTFDDLLATDGIPTHYRRFYELFSTHKSHCLPSVRRLRKARTAAKRFLQKRIFDMDDVDVIAFPRPHRLRTQTEPASTVFLMLDPAGALGFPAINLPVGFAQGEGRPSKNDHRRHANRLPIGLYLMTRPRKFKAMLDIGRIYEQSVLQFPFQTHLPPEFA